MEPDALLERLTASTPCSSPTRTASPPRPGAYRMTRRVIETSESEPTEEEEKEERAREMLPFSAWTRREISRRVKVDQAAQEHIREAFRLAWVGIDKNALEGSNSKYKALAPALELAGTTTSGAKMAWHVDCAYTDVIWDTLLQHRRVRTAVDLAMARPHAPPPEQDAHVEQDVPSSLPHAPPPEQDAHVEQDVPSSPDPQSSRGRTPPPSPAVRETRKRRASPPPPRRKKKRRSRKRRRGPGLGLCCTNCGHSFNLTAFLGVGVVRESASSSEE